ncbi:MAG: flavin reductase family protein [Woeseiaceae bacterium]
MQQSARTIPSGIDHGCNGAFGVRVGYNSGMPNEPKNNAFSAPKQDLRTAFGQFTTGVCIVSAPATDETDAFAITVNSFATVSLEPPLISWCVQKDSTSYALWMKSREFAVSILSSSQGSLCHHFAIRGNHIIEPDQPFELASNGNPHVVEALANFDCRVKKMHDAGDHTLIVAEVVDFQSASTQEPLIYFRGDIRA